MAYCHKPRQAHFKVSFLASFGELYQGRLPNKDIKRLPNKDIKRLPNKDIKDCQNFSLFLGFKFRQKNSLLKLPTYSLNLDLFYRSGLNQASRPVANLIKALRL